jgi:hypothetical protein
LIGDNIARLEVRDVVLLRFASDLLALDGGVAATR